MKTSPRVLFALAISAAGAFAQSPAAPGAAVADAKGLPPVTLESFNVADKRLQSYQAESVQMGAYRDVDPVDVPLTINVLTREVLDALAARGLMDALKNTAGVSRAQITGSVYDNLAIRGILIENRGNYRLNGSLPIVNLIDLPIENKARVEVLKGVSALYYGFTTPAGIVNLTSKRAPRGDAQILDATLFGTQRGTLGGHVDWGRRFADGRFGLRVNALYADLDIGVDHTSGDRSFGSVAADWAPTDSFKLEFDLERIDKSYSEPTTYIVGANGVLPPLPDPKKNLGGDWMQGKGYEDNALLTARWRFAKDWELSASAGRSYLDRNRYFSQFENFNAATGNGVVRATLTNGNVNENNNYRAELSGAFLTGPLKHEITFGYTQNKREAETPSNPAFCWGRTGAGAAPTGCGAGTNLAFQPNFNVGVELPEVALPARVVATRNKIDDKGSYVFDRVSYMEWLQVLVGVRYTDYSRVNITVASGARAPYDTTETTPAVGIVVKPRENLSLYATYIEGLEEGGVAPVGTLNVGEVLAPNTSEQYELGVKWELDKLLLTVGYFDIDRVSAFTNTAINRFVQDGRTTYKGFEFSASGEVGVGLSGGIPNVAEVYATINPSVEGGFTLTKHGNQAEQGHGEQGHGQQQQQPQQGHGEQQHGPPSQWSLVGSVAVKGSAKIGVALAGGIIDNAFELGSIDIFKLTGVYFDQTGFRKDKLGFEWGPKIKEAYEWVKKAIDKAKQMGRAAIEAAKRAGTAIANAGRSIRDWVTSW